MVDFTLTDPRIKLWINKGQPITYPQVGLFFRTCPRFDDNNAAGWPTCLKASQVLVFKEDFAFVHKHLLPLSTTTNLKSKSIEN